MVYMIFLIVTLTPWNQTFSQDSELIARVARALVTTHDYQRAIEFYNRVGGERMPHQMASFRVIEGIKDLSVCGIG